MKASDLTALLQQSESETLDFKRDQYPFAGETVEAKGELLKDILAETERLNRLLKNV